MSSQRIMPSFKSSWCQCSCLSPLLSSKRRSSSARWSHLEAILFLTSARPVGGACWSGSWWSGLTGRLSLGLGVSRSWLPCFWPWGVAAAGAWSLLLWLAKGRWDRAAGCRPCLGYSVEQGPAEPPGCLWSLTQTRSVLFLKVQHAVHLRFVHFLVNYTF